MAIRRCQQAAIEGSDGRTASTAPPSSQQQPTNTPLENNLNNTPPARPRPQQQQQKPDSSMTPRQRAALNTYDRYDEWTGSMMLRMVPDPGMPDYGKTPWVALFCIKCQDVPRLMREGFFWSVDNVLPEEGYMFHETKREWAEKGFNHARRWILTDKSNPGGIPRWVGWILVASPHVELVTRFRLHYLSEDMVCSANAWDAKGNLIYNFNCRVAGKNYNCIYDDKPLEGWWPWPKERGASRREFLPPGPGVRWEDELIPHMPLASRTAPRTVPAAASTQNVLFDPTGDWVDDTHSSSGCVVL